VFYAATPDPLPTELNRAALDTLLKTQPALWRGRERYSASASIPTGFAALDSALPAQGWGIGGVTELLVEQQGIGELSLLLPALQQVHTDKHTDKHTNNHTGSSRLGSSDQPTAYPLRAGLQQCKHCAGAATDHQ